MTLTLVNVGLINLGKSALPPRSPIIGSDNGHGPSASHFVDLQIVNRS